METRANYFLVGVFVIVFSAGALGFVVWLAKFQFDTTFAHYDVVYKGSVTGLKEGSAVRFSGVKVGEVTNIRLDPGDARKVLITVEVAKHTPVLIDTTASLEFEGLTGGRYILLHAGSPGAAQLAPDKGKTLPIITARSSSFEQVLQGAPAVLSGISRLLTRAESLLSEKNTENISLMIANVTILSTVLAKNSDAIDRLITDAADTMLNLRQTSEVVKEVAQMLQTEGGQLAHQVEETLKSIESLAQQTDNSVAKVTEDFRHLTQTLDSASAGLNRTLNEVHAMVAENREPISDFTSTGLYDLSSLLIEARDLIRELSRATTEVQRDPARFFFGDREQGYEAPK